VWLLQNLRDFKLSKPSWTWEQKMRQWIKDNYGLLDEDDQNKPITALQPNSKRLSFEFWLKISFHMSQFPPDDSWITFGFCTCQNRMETSCIAEMYPRLIERCSFQDFWGAVHNSSMIHLLDLHGFEFERRSLRHFQMALDDTKALPSAWYLKSLSFPRTPIPTFQAICVR
jgi:hypothetical protein